MALTMATEASSATTPKGTWRPSSQLVLTVVMKNCEPLLDSKVCQRRTRMYGGYLKQDEKTVRLSKGGGVMCKENLRVRAGIGHGQGVRVGVLEVQVLIGELLAIDGFSARSISSGEVATLNHETANV